MVQFVFVYVFVGFKCDDFYPLLLFVLLLPKVNDKEFEVTAEMMIHGTMDDETTLEVEEALQTKEEDVEELSGLQEVKTIGVSLAS